MVTIFKGLQLDIGAPPQFMDFRYTVHDRWHGEFHLDHCGALLDVEPMGEQYVFGMCHTIEDPTFDATAVATNARAQVRPDPPPAADAADRHPPALGPSSSTSPTPRPRHSRARHRPPNPCRHMGTRSHRRQQRGPGRLLGSMLCDFDFAAFSHSALVRIGRRGVLQMHLLYLWFGIAVRARAKDEAEGHLDVHRAADRNRGRGGRTIHKPSSCPTSSKDVPGARIAPPAQSERVRHHRRRRWSADRAAFAGSPGRLVDLVVLAGLGGAAAGDRHGHGSPYRGGRHRPPTGPRSSRSPTPRPRSLPRSRSPSSVWAPPSSSRNVARCR